MFSTTELSIHGFVPQIDGFMALKKNVLGFEANVTFKKIKIIIGIRGFQTLSKQVFILFHTTVNRAEANCTSPSPSVPPTSTL